MNTLYPILRADALGELLDLDDKELRRCVVILEARIETLQQQLATATNRLRHVTEDIRADMRWYERIRDKIVTHLTKALHMV